jgi:predicted dehydrogenase
MLKIGLVGVGHLGKIHAKLIRELSDIYEFVGFYDESEEVAKYAENEFSIPRFTELDTLLNAVEVVDIVTPTFAHFECAAKAIKKSKHVFIEKPVTNTVQEAQALLSLSQEANVKVQIGHVERFNPAFQQALPHIERPLFIETHRLAQFNPRGCDVPVVLDLMIHDLDIILSVVKSSVKRISASGVAVVSDTPDIANARIEFDNGCVANLTSSRISMKNMRKSRFFQKNAYISVDFLSKQTEIVTMTDVEGAPDPFDFILDLGEGKKSKKIHFDKPAPLELNAIKEELRTFGKSIEENLPVKVSIEDGLAALDIAHQIMEKLKYSSNFAGENIF